MVRIDSKNDMGPPSSAILSPSFKVLPYEIVEHQPFPVKIAWDGDAPPAEGEGGGMEVEGEAEGTSVPTNSVVMFDRGSNFPVQKRVTLYPRRKTAANMKNV